jgi:hypothetical protein
MSARSTIRLGLAGSLAVARVTIQLSGCAATTSVKDITDVKPGGKVEGVPFRVADHYRVRLFQLTPEGEYKEAYTTYQYLPNQEKVYAVNFSGDAFSDHEFKIELNDDNTIKTSSLKSTRHASDAAGALADQVSAVSTQLQTNKTNAQTKITTQQTAEENYIDLKGKADVAVEQYNAVVAKEDATAVDIASAKAAMDLAKKKANDAAINVGLPQPFPGGRRGRGE